MKKFRTVLNNKQKEHDLVKEKKILLGFRKVYDSLLEKYNISSFTDMQADNKPAFLAELNSYWSEDKGLSKKGKMFLRGQSDMLNEQSTVNQKKLYIKRRITPLINETLRQSELKYKMYDVINEVYTGIKAKDLNDVMSPEQLIETVLESFQLSLKEFMTAVQYEINENAKQSKKD